MKSIFSGAMAFLMLLVSTSAFAVTSSFSITFPGTRAQSYTGVHSPSGEHDDVQVVFTQAAVYEDGTFVQQGTQCTRIRIGGPGGDVPIGCGTIAIDETRTTSCAYTNDNPTNKTGKSFALAVDYSANEYYKVDSAGSGYRTAVYVPPGGGGY